MNGNKKIKEKAGSGSNCCSIYFTRISRQQGKGFVIINIEKLKIIVICTGIIEYCDIIYT